MKQNLVNIVQGSQEAERSDFKRDMKSTYLRWFERVLIRNDNVNYESTA